MHPAWRIFGEPTESPQNERTAVRPVSPYVVAKAFAHHMAAAFRSQGLHASTVIHYKPESPRRPLSHVTRKITRTVAEISRGKATELVLGPWTPVTGAGWAPDYVDATILALRHPAPGDYVVATGEGHTVRDFIAVAFDHAGMVDWQRYVRVDPALFRPVDASALVGYSTLAHTVLGWRPTRSFADLVGAMVDTNLAGLGGTSTT